MVVLKVLRVQVVVSPASLSVLVDPPTPDVTLDLVSLPFPVRVFFLCGLVSFYFALPCHLQVKKVNLHNFFYF